MIIMGENIELDLKNMKIDQLGYVYKDIEKQAKIMEETFGIPPFAILEGTNTIIYRGKELEYSARIGISRWLGTQIELIQPLKGQSSHTEFLDKGREGLQHISLFVDDIDPYVEDFKKKGFEISQSGQIGKQKFVYFDTEEAFGLSIEFQMTEKRRRKK